MNQYTKSMGVNSAMLASKSKRFANFIIDYVIKLALALILGIVASILYDYFDFYLFLEFIENMNTLQEYLFGFVITFFYYVIMELFTLRSVGKYITKTKVLSVDGSLPTEHQIIIRTLCRFIPFEPFSFLGGNPKGWHDTLSKTVVVDIEKYEDELFKQQAIDSIGEPE